MLLQRLFQILASAVSIYSTLCFIRIILSWFPGAMYSKPGQLLAQIVDPYMNLFSRLPLRIGMIDFSPTLSLGILYLVSSILSNIAATGIFSVRGTLSSLINLVWSVVFSIFSIFLIFLLIRVIVLMVNRGTTPYDSIWSKIDYSIRDRVFRMARFFTGGRPCSFTKALWLAILELALILALGYAVCIGLNFAISFIPV